MKKRSIVGKEFGVYGIWSMEWGRKIGREIVGNLSQRCPGLTRYAKRH